MLTYNNKHGLHDITSDVKINHSEIAPGVADIRNRVRGHDEFFAKKHIDTSLTGIEFAWNVPTFDVDSDGDLDMYLAGVISRGNDDFLGDWSGNPGRLLVNESTPGHFEFTDRTLEYRLLDIVEMDYDHTSRSFLLMAAASFE